MCSTCNDTGLLASAPEGETIYCEECTKGLTKALRIAEAHIVADEAWVARRKAEQIDCEDAQATLELEKEERARLLGLLREIDRDAEEAFVRGELA